MEEDIRRKRRKEGWGRDKICLTFDKNLDAPLVLVCYRLVEKINQRHCVNYTAE